MGRFWRATKFRVGVPETPSENFSPDAGRGSLRIWTDFADRQQTLEDFVGWTERREYADAVTQTYYWHREYPFQHETLSQLFCNACNFEPDKCPIDLDSAQQLSNYSEAACTLGFATPTYGILSDEQMKILQASAPNAFQANYPDESALIRYCTIQRSPKGYMQTTPGLAALRHVAPGAIPVVNTCYVNITYWQLQITQHQVPLVGLPAAALDSCVNHVNRFTIGFNSTALGPLAGPYAPGTLLCQAATIGKPYLMTNNRFAVDVTHNWEYRPNYGRLYSVAAMGQQNGFANGPILQPRTPLGVNAFFLWNPPGAFPVGFYCASRDGHTYLDTVTGQVVDGTTGLPGDEGKLFFPPEDFSVMLNPAHP